MGTNDTEIPCEHFRKKSELKNTHLPNEPLKTKFQEEIQLKNEILDTPSEVVIVFVNFGKCKFAKIDTRIDHRLESAIDFSLHGAFFLNCFFFSLPFNDSHWYTV